MTSDVELKLVAETSPVVVIFVSFEFEPPTIAVPVTFGSVTVTLPL